MNSAVTQVDGEMIAHSVQVREKSLAVLRSASRPRCLAVIALLVFITAVCVQLFVFAVDFPARGWPQLVVAFLFMLCLALTAVLWHMNRRLCAVIDLMLLNEEKKR